MNKKENRKVEDFSNHVAKFYFSRSIYIFLKQDTILYHYHFIKRHFNIRECNSTVLDSPLCGMHLKCKTCSIVLFLILPGTKQNLCNGVWERPCPWPLSDLPWALLLSLFGKVVPTWHFLAWLQQHPELFPSGKASTATLDRLHHQFCWGFMSKELVVEKAQQRQQLLAGREPSSCLLSWQGCLLIYCAWRWLYSCLPPLLSHSGWENPMPFILMPWLKVFAICLIGFQGFLYIFCRMFQCRTQHAVVEQGFLLSGFDQIFFLNSKPSLSEIGKQMKYLMCLDFPLCTLHFISICPSSWG